MMLSSVLLPALASLAIAESTVTSMYILGADRQPLAASIMGNDASATTYSINCPPGTDSNDCGMGPGMTVIAADETTTYIMNDGDFFQFTAECSVGKSIAVCTESAGGPEANFPGVETATEEVSYMPVTVTAGSVTSAGASTATSTSTSSTSTGTGASASEEATAAGSASATRASETASQSAEETAAQPSETGAAVRVTGVVGLAFGGAAVALMGAGI
ncbi:hypothetical protein BDW72DRAFT_178848 [Aspergillus terricola var. indicus]